MKDKKDNVIAFPKANTKVDKDQETVEKIHHNLEMMKQYHIQETILNIMPMIFNQLDIAGFGLEDDDDFDDIKDGAFIVEAIRSFMSKYYGIYHPFQIIADNVFESQSDEMGHFKIVEKLDLELVPPEEDIDIKPE